MVCPKNALFPKNGGFKLSCMGRVDDSNVMDLVVEPSVNDEHAMSFPQFWYIFAALAFSWIGMAVVVSIGDAICFDLLGKRHEMYGRQRLWGAIGFGAFTLIAGAWVDSNSGPHGHKNYSVIYYLMAVALLPNTFVSSCLEVSSMIPICMHTCISNQHVFNCLFIYLDNSLTHFMKLP